METARRNTAGKVRRDFITRYLVDSNYRNSRGEANQYLEHASGQPGTQQPILRLSNIPPGGVLSLTKKEKLQKQRSDALDRLAYLLPRKSDQVVRFGAGGLKGHLLKRYEMVHAFLRSQKKSPERTRKDTALAVANTFGRGEHTARWIIRWERGWIANSTIPAAEGYGKSAGKGWIFESLFFNEELQLLIRDYISRAKDGKSHPTTIYIVKQL